MKIIHFKASNFKKILRYLSLCIFLPFIPFIWLAANLFCFALTDSEKVSLKDLGGEWRQAWRMVGEQGIY